MKNNSQIQSFAALLMAVASLAASNTEAAVGRIAGEASVNAVGAATYSIPLTLPRGTHGLTPSLSLNYNSGGDNGLLGVGWSIGGLSAISRCGRTWAQEQEARDVRRDASDRFCLDGNKLRLVTGTYGSFGATYKTEIADFSVVTSTNDGSGNQYFVVKARDGLTYEYGFTVDSRVEILGHLSDIRVWALDKVSDPSGNAMVFSYTKQTTGTGADGSYRISSIQYTSSTGVTAPYSVEFTYETKPTTEIDSRYFADGVIKQIRRLDRVDIKYNGSAVRIYDLTYESALSSTGKSRLQSVTQCAATLGDCLPPTAFTYQNGTPGLGNELATSISIPTGITPWAIDVNGDGRDDLVYASAPTSGNWVVQFASASGGYVAASGAQPANTNFAQATPIDYDSDGMMDMLVPNSSGTWSVMLGSAAGLANPVDTGAPVTTTGKGLNARAFDVDGDGRDDLVWADLVGYTGTGDAIRYRTRLQSGAGFSSTVGVLANYGPDTIFASGVFAPVGQPGPKRVPDFNGDGRGDLYFRTTTRNFIDPNYVYTTSITALCSGGCGPGGSGFSQTGPITSDPMFGDFNGDGKTDILYYDSAGSFKVRLSTGYSFTSVIGGPSLSNYGRWVIADWDGDGNDDLLARVTSTAAWDVARFTGEAFATAVPTGAAAGSNNFTIADINGDGLPDLGSTNASGVWTYRLHSGVYPDLLKTVTDGYGNVVTYNYAPLPSANHTPNLTLPIFPEQNFHGAINLVTSYSAPDGIGGTYTNTFAYWGAVVNLQGRGFEGFEAVRVIDSRNGLATVDHYKQGFPFTGMVVEHNVWRDDLVNLISHTENQVADTSLSATTHEERHFPHVTTSTSDEYEVHPSDPKDHQLITRSITGYTFDTAGNATNVSTQLTDKDAESPYYNYFWTTTTQSTLSSTPDGCTGLPTQVSVTNTPPASMSLPSIVRTTSYTANYTQCRFSQIVTEPSNGTYQVTHDLGYDSFGNLTTDTVTAAGVAGTRMTSVNYGTDGRFPIQVSNALGEHTDMTYDVGLGVPLTITDPNVLTVTLTYDSFGRKIKEQRPDLTSSNWAFANCAPSNCLNGNNQTIVTLTQKNNGGTDLTDELIYLDKFDRPIAASQKLLGTARNRVELHYDTLGRVSQQSAPCDAASCTTYWTTMTYDDANRIIAASRPRKVSDLTLQSTSISYLGRKTIVTDAEGKQSTKIAMVTGWMGRSIDHNSYEQRFTYDAFGSLLSVTDDHSNSLFAATYDYGIGAFQRTITDMDLGARSYVFDALGELKSGLDAKSQPFSMTYDALSRPLTRLENEGTVQFVYGNAAASHNLGRLQSMNSPGYTEQFTYDGLGRLSNRHIVTDQAYDYDYSYDVTTGLPDTLTYPTSTSGGRLKLQYGYQNGVLQQVKDYNSSTVFWYANQTNSRGQVTQQTLGNGIVSNLSFDAITGWLDNIQSGLGGGTGVQNASYQYDRVGNVTQRQNNRLGLTEDVHYDSLHRLSYSQLGGATNLSLAYDYMGNITSRSDIASGAAWTYDSVKKHAVRTAGDSSHTYTYDNNGNAITRNGYGITWTSYDYPSVINGPNKSMTFSYGPDRQRFKQVYTNGSTLETTMYVGGMLEKVTAGGVTDWRHYVSANGQTVAIVSRLSTGTNTTRYVLEDQQGSIAEVIGTGTSDTFSESFTPFGARRDAATWSGSCNCTDLGKMKGVTRMGYTGQEAIGGQSLGLNHMNGRVQDAITGRFLSPDPYVTEPGNTQGFNRYSYVNNNPLSYTDPSGFAPADGSPDDGDNRACTGNFCINVHIPFLCEDWTCSRGIQRGLVPISLADNERRASRYVQFESQGALTADAQKRGASTGPTSTVGGASPDDRAFPSFFRGIGLEYRSVVDGPAPLSERIGRDTRHVTDVAMNVLMVVLTGGRSGAVGNGARVVTAAEGAQNIVNGVRLSEQLTFEHAASVFTTGGRLGQEAINGASEIIPAGALRNPAIPAGFAKFTTETFRSPAGPFQVHFYMNPATREVLYDLDYKIIFNNGL